MRARIRAIGSLALVASAALIGVAFAVVGPAVRAFLERPPQFERALADIEERAGVRAMPIDADVSCAGRLEYRLAVLALESGPRFFDAFPEAPPSAELIGADTSLSVVVYRGVYPGGVLTRPGSGSRTTTMPGSVDVCVIADNGVLPFDGARYAVFGDVPLEGSVLTIR